MLSIRATADATEYALPMPPAAVRASIDSWYDNGRFPELRVPDGEPPIKVGSLLWPVVGARRFARGLFVIDGESLTALRVALTVADDNAVTLSYRDAPTGSETARTFPLFLIASRPLSETGAVAEGEDDAYLILLADQRYYWGLLEGSGTANDPADWAAVFSAMFGRVGASYTLDPVHADYLPPTERWSGDTARRTSTAFLLDYAAACVGSRIVVTPAGVHVQRPEAAYLTVAADYHAAAVLDSRFGGGGTIPVYDQLVALPGRARARWEHGAEYGTDLPTGDTAKIVQVWHDAPGRYGIDGVADLEAHADRWAADWYAWQYAPLDSVYDGFLTPPATGFVGSVELYHDTDAGYTRVSRPPVNDDPPPAWVPDDFPAVLTGVYGSGGAAAGHPWAAESPVFAAGLVPAPATGEYAYGVGGVADDDENPWTGLTVMMHPVGFGGPWYFEEPPVAGCGVVIDYGTNEVSIDLDSIAGDGLVVNPGETEDDCPYLSVDRESFYEAGLGCGLSYDQTDDKLKIDLTDVVFDGLYFDADICALGVQVGCGVTYVPCTTPGCEGDGIGVDYEALAGDQNETALVVVSPGAECDSLGVDLLPFRETTESLVNDITFAMADGKLRVTKTITEYTNKFNAAGLHIDRVAGDPVEYEIDIDVCKFQECCEADQMGVNASVDDQTPEPGVAVNFTGSATGGVPPYTWHWDFGDGTESTDQNPSHTYAAAGTYLVVLTVTDACGRTEDDGIEMTVTMLIDTACCDDVPPSLNVLWETTAVSPFKFADDHGRNLTLVYDGSQYWQVETTSVHTGATVWLRMYCDNGTWRFQFEDDDTCAVVDVAAVSGQCDPFEQVFSMANTCFFGTMTFTVTP
jgi:hypothetical protein